MLIMGEQTYLAAMEPDDAPLMQEWMNDLELRKLAWTECALPSGRQAARDWIEMMNANPRTRLLAIRRLDDGEIVGFMSLRNISWISRSMRFGNLIWPASLRNRGLGTDARRAMLRYAFEQLGMERVYGFFGAYNAASRRSHEKLGGEVTATLREAIYLDGRYHDACYYVYRRESFAGAGDPATRPAPPGRPDGGGKHPGHDVERTYEDFYGRAFAERPPKPPGSILVPLAGGVDFVPAEVPRHADLLFYPRRKDALPYSLVRAAVDEGFARLNLHRLQTCLPSSAVAWRDTLLRAGFIEEGRLDGVIWAGNARRDLVFFGLLRS